MWWWMTVGFMLISRKVFPNSTTIGSKNALQRIRMRQVVKHTSHGMRTITKWCLTILMSMLLPKEKRNGIIQSLTGVMTVDVHDTN